MPSKRQRILGFITVCAAALVLVSCASQPPSAAYDPPGFFSGLLHGLLIVFSFVGGWFSDVRIYAYPNTGGWYDFGYLIGTSVWSGTVGVVTGTRSR